VQALRITRIDSLDDRRARAAGQLCGIARTRDVLDASVIPSAREHGYAVATSDRAALARLDPKAKLIPV
jgi:hypothetical protein